MDNYAAHKHRAVRAWLADNPRVHAHCRFSMAERQAIHRGSSWTKTPDDILAEAVPRGTSNMEP
jgi:hypothetical protein